MNIGQYRKRLEQQVAKRKRALTGSRPGPSRISAKASAKARVAAIDSLQFDRNLDRTIPALIQTLGDSGEPEKVRLAAFRALKTASFLGPVFAPYRAGFIKCLHEIATDPSPAIRQEALEALSAEKVPAAKALLHDGLKDRDRALVPPAKAIQLLSFDGHAKSAPLVRAVLKAAKDTATKEAAIRFLASDPGSAPLLSRLLKDKSQPSRIRSASAAGLRLLNPAGFEKVARKIVEDGKEDDALRATCLGALTHIGGYRRSRANPAFVKRVASLQASSSSTALRTSAKRFLAKREK